MNRKLLASLPLASLAAALLATSLAGCAPLVLGGAALGTALMVSDRRSSGAQIDDEAIELRATTRVTDALGSRVHVNITSYNRQVLLTGEVPSEALRQQVEQIVRGVENVRVLINDVAVMPPSSLAQRSSDTLVTGKVRASILDANDLQSNAFKVITERGTVYLMGRVTAHEADRATSIARQIGGVSKVVRVFEVVSPDDLRHTGAVAPVAPAPQATPAAPAPMPAPQPQPAPAGAVTSPVR